MIIHHPPELEDCVALVKTYFKEQIFNHPRLKDRAREAQSFIKKLCEKWTEPGVEIPKELRELYPRHTQMIGEARTPDQRTVAVCYFVACLTDLEVIDCHSAIFSPTFSIFRA